ncbi:unnamed protein product, partial [Didymodactylos carnosus]
LIKMGQFSKTIKYFENLLNQTTLNDNERYGILAYKSDAYNSNQEFDLGLKYSVSEFNMQTNLYQGSWILPFKLMSLAQIHFAQDNYDLALESYKFALKLFDNENNFKRPAIIHSNIGQIHYLKIDFFSALKHFQQSLEIFMELHSENFDEIISLNYHIAIQHLKELQFDEKNINSLLSVSTIGECETIINKR